MSDLRAYLRAATSGLRDHLAKSRATGPGSHGSHHWYINRLGEVVYGDLPKPRMLKQGERVPLDEIPHGTDEHPFDGPHHLRQGKYGRYLIVPGRHRPNVDYRGQPYPDDSEYATSRHPTRLDDTIEVHFLGGDEPRLIGFYSGDVHDGYLKPFPYTNVVTTLRYAIGHPDATWKEHEIRDSFRERQERDANGDAPYTGVEKSLRSWLRKSRRIIKEPGKHGSHAWYRNEEGEVVYGRPPSRNPADYPAPRGSYNSKAMREVGQDDHVRLAGKHGHYILASMGARSHRRAVFHETEAGTAPVGFIAWPTDQKGHWGSVGWHQRSIAGHGQDPERPQVGSLPHLMYGTTAPGAPLIRHDHYITNHDSQIDALIGLIRAHDQHLDQHLRHLLTDTVPDENEPYTGVEKSLRSYLTKSEVGGPYMGAEKSLRAYLDALHKSHPVQNPGLHGSRDWYRDETGKVIYGTPPGGPHLYAFSTYTGEPIYGHAPRSEAKIKEVGKTVRAEEIPPHAHPDYGTVQYHWQKGKYGHYLLAPDKPYVGPDTLRRMAYGYDIFFKPHDQVPPRATDYWNLRHKDFKAAQRRLLKVVGHADYSPPSGTDPSGYYISSTRGDAAATGREEHEHQAHAFSEGDPRRNSYLTPPLDDDWFDDEHGDIHDAINHVIKRHEEALDRHFENLRFEPGDDDDVPRDRYRHPDTRKQADDDGPYTG